MKVTLNMHHTLMFETMRETVSDSSGRLEYWMVMFTMSPNSQNCIDIIMPKCCHCSRMATKQCFGDVISCYTYHRI